MSSLVPEGMPAVPATAPEPAPAPVAEPAPVVVAVPAPKQGLRPSHVAGGGFAGVAGAVVVAVCNHFGWPVSDVDAVLIGGAAVSAGVGVGHVISTVGVRGAFAALWRGQPGVKA